MENTQSEECKNQNYQDKKERLRTANKIYRTNNKEKIKANRKLKQLI